MWYGLGSLVSMFYIRDIDNHANRHTESLNVNQLTRYSSVLFPFGFKCLSTMYAAILKLIVLEIWLQELGKVLFAAHSSCISVASNTVQNVLAHMPAFTLVSNSSNVENKSSTPKKGWVCDPLAIMERAHWGDSTYSITICTVSVPEGLEARSRCRYRWNLRFENRYRYYWS